MGTRPPEQRLYEQLWSNGMARIRAGRVEVDPVLKSRTPDRRRGFTVIIRPSAAVQASVGKFLQGLKELEPDQYYYTRSEFHITVLSLFTATEEYQPFFAQRERYFAAVQSALAGLAPMRIEFRGVTTSPGTVMIQGYANDARLNRARDALRRSLRAAGLGTGLDTRYRLRTAHMTVVRFREQLRDSRRFARNLQGFRHRAFGAMAVESLTLVENDWYMSHAAVRTIRRYKLQPQALIDTGRT